MPNSFKFLRAFKYLKLAKKLKLILIFIFVVSILISGASLSILLQRKAQEVTYKELDALSQVMSATVNFYYKVPNQNGQHIAALDNQFIPMLTLEKIFDNLRTNANYQDYDYEQFNLNPNILQNDKFKTHLSERFRGSTIKDSGFHLRTEGKSFYIAWCYTDPYFNNSKSCRQYDDQSILVHIIYVPATKIFAAARQFWLLTMRMLFAISAVAMGTINLLLNRTIIKPIAQISKDARLVSTGKADVDFEQCSKDEKRSKDEIVSLVASFNRMKSSLKIAKKLQKKEKRSN